MHLTPEEQAIIARNPALQAQQREIERLEDLQKRINHVTNVGLAIGLGLVGCSGLAWIVSWLLS